MRSSADLIERWCRATLNRNVRFAMQPTAAISRPHVWAAVAMLGGFAVWVLSTAGPVRDPFGIGLGLLALATAITLARGSRWSRLLAPCLAGLLIAYSAVLAISSDGFVHFRRMSVPEAASSLAPGLILCTAAVYCAFVAMRATNRRTQT